MANFQQAGEHRSVLLLGHSFVRRFGEYLVSPPHPFRSDLNLPAGVQFYCQGVGGRIVPSLIRYDLGAVDSVRPDVIVLEIGSNDLCDPSVSFLTIGSAIDDLCALLMDRFQVRHVVVCQILRRIVLPYPAFNEQVLLLNNYLEVVIGDRAHATFWKHRGFWHNTSILFCPDGVHPNYAGLGRLYRSYRGAILQALPRL